MENGQRVKQEDSQLKQGVAAGPGSPRRPGERLGRCWSACGCKTDRSQGQLQEFGPKKNESVEVPLTVGRAGLGLADWEARFGTG